MHVSRVRYGWINDKVPYVCSMPGKQRWNHGLDRDFPAPVDNSVDGNIRCIRTKAVRWRRRERMVCAAISPTHSSHSLLHDNLTSFTSTRSLYSAIPFT